MKEEQATEKKLKKDNQTEVAVSSNVSEKSRKHFKYRSNECLNCGQPLDLSDRYCPYCSQLNSTKPLTLSDFITEFFSNIISYDSRLRFTVVDLLFKPGVISKNYIHGKRLRYTNPFRFFLSVSIIYFLLYSVFNFFEPKYDVPLFNINYETKDDSIDTEQTIIFKDSIKNSPKEQTAKADSLKQIKKEIDNKKGYVIVLGDTIDIKSGNYTERVAKINEMGRLQGLIYKIEIFRSFYEEKQIKNPKTALNKLNIENNGINRWLYKKNNSIESIKESPRDFINYLLSKVPFFVFFFAPIYALFFWLLYIRKKFTYMEHLVFIFHIFSFVFLTLIIGALPDLLFDMELFSGLVFTIIGPIYFFLALRKFYEQSYIKTTIKFILLNIFLFISSIVAAIVFFAGTAALY